MLNYKANLFRIRISVKVLKIKLNVFQKSTRTHTMYDHLSFVFVLGYFKRACLFFSVID